MRRAAKVDGNHAEIVDTLRGYGCLVLSLAQLGSGIPDLLVATPRGLDGRRRLGLVEVKNSSKPPSKRRLTDDQVAFWDEWKDTPLALVDNVDSALRFARMLTFDGKA